MPDRSDLIREILDGPRGPRVGAFFDVDRTLLAGFSAAEFIRDGIVSGRMGAATMWETAAAIAQFQLGQIGFSSFVAGTSGALHGMHATRAAVEEGVVPGGGVALIRSSAVLDGLKGSEEEKVGISIVKRAIEEPLRWIAQNAGWEGSVVLDKVRQNKGSFGFNAAGEEFEDLMKAGIIDPTKVVRTALQNAASVAGLLLTTEAIVTEKPEEKKPAAAPPPEY